MTEGVVCPCGCGRRYSDPILEYGVRRLVMAMGETVKVDVNGERAWLVPRHYIALHGLKASQVPALAARFGWQEG